METPQHSAAGGNSRKGGSSPHIIWVSAVMPVRHSCSSPTALFWRAGKERTEDGPVASCRKEERLLLVVSAMLSGDRTLSGPATAKGPDMLLKLFQVLLLTMTSIEGRLPCIPCFFYTCGVQALGSLPLVGK